MTFPSCRMPSCRILVVSTALNVLGLLTLAAPTFAATDADLSRCRSLIEDAARLACYDSLAAGPKPSPSAGSPAAASPAAPAITGASPAAPATSAASPASPASAPAAAPPAAVSAAQGFGAEAIPAKPKVQPKRLAAKVIGKVDGVRKGLTLTLDNGQRWQSIDEREYDYVRLANPAVELDRSVVGSYWMTFLDEGLRFRVKRIK